MPAVEVLEDGSHVFVTWYDHVNGDLILGTLAEVDELALAQAEPDDERDGRTRGIPDRRRRGPPCESTGKTAEIAAPPGAAAAGFDTQCLAVDADAAVR